MKRYRKPHFLKTGPKEYIVVIPWVQTSGAPGSIYEWNNAAHAAVHSLLAGLRCAKKKDVQAWLKTARDQVLDAVKVIQSPRAKVPPYQEPKPAAAGKPGKEHDER